MAKLPTIKQVTREDLRDAPDWIEKLLTPLNQFMGSVYQALNGDLSIGANVRGSVRELRVTTSATYDTGDFPEVEFASGLNVKATSCQVAQISVFTDPEAVITGGVFAHWAERSGRIVIKYIAGLENSTKYTVRFLVL